MTDSWKGGLAYERFMGRWSMLVARQFLSWLAIGPRRTWLDVGCGTGSLTTRILEGYGPSRVISIDASRDFTSHARKSISDKEAHFGVGLAQLLPVRSDSMDAVVSGLVLNFVPKPEDAIADMIRAAKPGGTIGIFVWDYAEGMQMLRRFWDAAVELDAQAAEVDEGLMFTICLPGRLESLAKQVGLNDVQGVALEAVSVFQDFDDYWQPFLGGVGPASRYLLSLAPARREELADRLRKSLPAEADGSISLGARAWAVKGRA